MPGSSARLFMFYIAIATMMRTEAERPDPYAPPAEINAVDQYMKVADQSKKLRLYQPPCRSKDPNGAMPEDDELTLFSIVSILGLLITDNACHF
jgi:hypothetical protein